MRLFQVLVVAFVFVGSLLKINLVWELSDLFNGLMVVPNLIALLALSPVVIKLLNDYDAKKPYKRDDYLNNRS